MVVKCGEGVNMILNKYDKKLESVRHGYIVGGATIGLVLAGLAPATLFGYSLYRALVADGWEAFIAGIAGGALAVTMEVIGGVSAHVAQTSQNKQRRIIGGGILATYTLVGLIYMLFFEPNLIIKRIGTMAYIVAPLLYFAVSMLNATANEKKEIDQTKKTDEQEKQRQHEIDIAKLKYQQEQDAADRTAERQQKARQAEIDAQVKTETMKEAVALKIERERTKQAKIERQLGDSSADTLKTDIRHFSDTEILRLVDFTPEEIMSQYGVIRKTANRWLEKSNKLSAKLSVKVSQNGMVK